MSSSSPNTLFYKRSTFVTHLPVHFRYSPTHVWLEEIEPGKWRTGFTKFATRMLGEIVDHQFEKAAGDAIRPGDVVGSIEGFKAISDLYSVVEGKFIEGNPALRDRIELVGEDPYGAGWLYMVEGTPDANTGDVEAYRQLLDGTIDRILEQQKSEDSH